MQERSFISYLSENKLKFYTYKIITINGVKHFELPSNDENIFKHFEYVEIRKKIKYL